MAGSSQPSMTSSISGRRPPHRPALRRGRTIPLETASALVTGWDDRDRVSVVGRPACNEQTMRHSSMYAAVRRGDVPTTGINGRTVVSASNSDHLSRRQPQTCSHVQALNTRSLDSCGSPLATTRTASHWGDCGLLLGRLGSGPHRRATVLMTLGLVALGGALTTLPFPSRCCSLVVRSKALRTPSQLRNVSSDARGR
jgi:hypothetical protein